VDHLARWISNQVRLKCKKVNRTGRLSKDRIRGSAALLRQLVKLVLCRDLVQALGLCSLHPTLLTDAYHATPTELYYILCYIHGFDGFDKNIAKKYFAAIKNTIMIDESNADATGGGERFGMSSLFSDDILQLHNAIVIIYMAYMAKVKDLVRGGIYPLNKQLMERAATHMRQRYCWIGNPGETPSEITHLDEFGLGRELVQEISLSLLIPTCCVVSSSSSINTESASTVNNLDIDFWHKADSEGGPVERRAGPSGVNNDLHSDLLDSESDEELNKDLSVYAELSLEEKEEKFEKLVYDNKCGESMEVDPTGSAHNNVDTEEFIGDETTNTSTMDSDKKISWAQPLERVLDPVTNGSNPITRDEPMNNNITSDALLEPLAQPDLLDMIDSPTADMKEVHQCFQSDEGDSAVMDIDIDEEFVMLFGTETVHNATDNDQEPEETMATATITNAANNTTVLSRYNTSSPVASIKCVSSQATFIRDDNDNSVSPEDSSIASLHVFTGKESITPGSGGTVIDKGIDDDSGSLEDSSFASLQVLTGKESITRGFVNDNGVDAVQHMIITSKTVKARGTKTDGANNTLASTSATSYPFSWISSDDVGRSRVGNGSPSPGDLQARWNQRNSLLFKPIPDVPTEPSLTPPSPTCLSPAHQGSDLIVCTYKEMKLMIPAIYGLCRLSKGIMNPSPTIEQLPASGSMFRACVTDEKSEHVAEQASDASKSRSLLLLARVAVNDEKEEESTKVPHCSFGGNMSAGVDESRSAPAANSTGTSITSGKRGTKRPSIVLDEAEELTRQLECKLTVEEQATIRCAVNGGGSQTEILARQGTNSVQRGSMETLQPGQWLNDEVINYFLKTCLAKSDEMLCSKQPGRKRSHFFNSFFVQTMFNEKNKDPKLQGKYCYNSVRRWGQEVPGKDIFNLKKIVVPVNIVNKHWACMVIFMDEKKIHYFDSLGMTDRDKLKLKGLLQYLKDEYESTKKGKFDASEWELVDCSLDIPRQLNGKYLQ